MITHVAIVFKGVTYSLPAPSRHHDVIYKLARQFPDEETIDGAQGFLDDTAPLGPRPASDPGTAPSRPLRDCALHEGQLLPRAPTDGRGGCLYSEDIW